MMTVTQTALMFLLAGWVLMSLLAGWAVADITRRGISAWRRRHDKAESVAQEARSGDLWMIAAHKAERERDEAFALLEVPGRKMRFILRDYKDDKESRAWLERYEDWLKRRERE